MIIIWESSQKIFVVAIYNCILEVCHVKNNQNMYLQWKIKVESIVC